MLFCSTHTLSVGEEHQQKAQAEHEICIALAFNNSFCCVITFCEVKSTQKLQNTSVTFSQETQYTHAASLNFYPAEVMWFIFVGSSAAFHIFDFLF